MNPLSSCGQPQHWLPSSSSNMMAVIEQQQAVVAIAVLERLLAV